MKFSLPMKSLLIAYCMCITVVMSFGVAIGAFVGIFLASEAYGNTGVVIVGQWLWWGLLASGAAVLGSAAALVLLSKRRRAPRVRVAASAIGAASGVMGLGLVATAIDGFSWYVVAFPVACIAACVVGVLNVLVEVMLYKRF